MALSMRSRHTGHVGSSSSDDVGGGSGRKSSVVEASVLMTGAVLGIKGSCDVSGKLPAPSIDSWEGVSKTISLIKIT